MRRERSVGGLRCGEVLACLADYLAGELEARVRERVEAHLAGCDVCERFGGDYARVVACLRRILAAPDPPPDGFEERLLRAFEEAAGEPGH
ncbi:MAG: anti-sigma factor [Planctomycetota bacterium]|nr:MAG: anti-sigma factor [Planctomycetota bacterium]